MQNQEITLGWCWMFPDTTPEEGLSRLKACGFDGVELWPDFLHKYGAARWAQALSASGMTCVQLCPYFDFVHGKQKLSDSRRMLSEFLDAARVLSCRRLRVFTGPPWGAGVVGAKDASPAQWQAAISGLQEFCDRAPDMEFCLECHAGSLMEDAPSALRLLDSVARANLTVNLQLPLENEDWQSSIWLLGPHTTHIHIHNWKEGLGQGALTFLGAGAFDWQPVLRQLPRPLCLSVEHADHEGQHSPWETAQRDGAYLRELRLTLF